MNRSEKRVAANTLKWLGVLLALSLAGCGHCAAHKDQIANLERELSQVKAQKANLAAKNTQLDDQLVRLKSTVERKPPQKKQLKVVRVTPSQRSDSHLVGADPRLGEYAPEQIDDGGERPVLTLGTGNRQASRPRPRAPRAAGSKRATGTPIYQGADNLGIVGGGVVGNGSTGTTVTANAIPMEVFNQAYKQYSNKNYKEAIAGFDNFSKNFGNHAYADDALYWKGECFYEAGAIFKAIAQFERVVRKHPRSNKAPVALYKLGYAYDQLRDTAKATELYFEVVDRYPGTEAARKASRRVAVLTADGGGNVIHASANR